MDSSMYTGKVIDLKDMLYWALRHWRKILKGAVVIALIAGLYQACSGLRVILDDQKLADARENYEIALRDYEATGERLKTSIINLRDQSTNQQEYNSKSMLMKINCMDKWSGNIVLYIDSKYQIDPTLTYQNLDMTNRLISAYAGYLRSGEFYQELLTLTPQIDEIRFLTEIFGVSADPGTATITVNCIGTTEAEVRQMLDFVKTKLAERFETIRNTIGDHSYNILTESAYSTIDLSLDATQKNNLLAVTEYANRIGETNKELSEWENSPEPQPEFGTLYTIKQTIKFIIFGGIIGVVVMSIWFTVKYIMSNTVKTEDDWKTIGIPVLGYIFKEEEKRGFRWLDEWIDRLFARKRSTTMEQDCVLMAWNLNAMQQKLGEVKLVGHVDRAEIESIVQKMETAAPGTGFSFAGDPKTEPDTANNLGTTEKVILVAENRKTQMRDIGQILTLLNAWGKMAIGAIVIESRI